MKESPFFEVNEAQLPKEEEIREICGAYLEEIMNKTAEVYDEQQLQTLCNEVYKCLGLCNFYWAVWSIMMDNNHTDFGYLEHGSKRLELFKRIYNQVLEQKKF